MRDFRKCPGRTREEDWRTRDIREIARCGATSAVLGFDHAVSESVCEECAAEGAPDTSNPFFWKLVRGRLRARMWAGPEAEYPETATPEKAFHELVADGHVRQDEARDILREAVKRGMDSQRAADMADREGVGDI